MLKAHLPFLVLAATLTFLAGCGPTASIDEARSSYFATVDGSDADCEGWLEWCLAEGYPREGCEERNEYCVDGEWVGGEDSDDPCEPAAQEAYDDCIEDGGSEEQCREEAAEAYEDCAGE
ncbi:MAG: hypothetical protein VX498_10365 [Myxococcota bacterium]|nr:hypothetical protein [Myxococcota bacterium]